MSTGRSSPISRCATRRLSPSSRRLRSRRWPRRMPLTEHLSLESSDLPEAWDRGDAAGLGPEFHSHIAEVKQRDPAYAAFYARALSGFAGAQSEDELRERHTLVLGRERGILTKKLEVEHEEYNFTKLNFPPDHPARDAHDTYFVSDTVLLRTHTSPGWVRAMEERTPPLRLVFPGRVYRAEQVDASHMDQFHQIDGLFVAQDVSMGDLKATLNTFARAIYGPDARTRLIPI